MNSFFNFTLPSSSPVVLYSQEPGWSQFASQASSTSQADFYHLAQRDQAKFQFSFQGSAVELQGNANCTFDITLDEQVFSGLSATGTKLFNVSNLSPLETHTLSLQAHPVADTSLSFEKAIIFTLATNVTIQSVPSPPLFYSPEWSSNSTARFTNTRGAFAEWNFTGINSIEVLGSLALNHGAYQVSLDNIVTTYNASSSLFIPSTTKFYAGNLNENGTHTLRVTNIQDDSVLTISEVKAYHIQNLASFDQAAPSPSTTASATKFDQHKLSIIILPIAIVLFFLILGAFYFFLRRRRHRASNNMEEAKNVVPFPNLRTSMSMASSKNRFGDWDQWGKPRKPTKAPTTAASILASAAPRKIGLPKNPKAMFIPKA